MKRLSGILVAVICLVVAMPTIVRAGAFPHDRNGFMIGGSLGVGSLGFKDGGDRETSATGNFRIGYAVRSDVVIHLESNAWVKTYKYDDPFLGAGDFTVTSSAAVVAVTLYPEGTGVYLRAGIGGGRQDIEVKMDNGPTVSFDDNGLALLGAIGYEWRLTPKFALGPHAGFTYSDVDLLGASTMFGGSLDFDWYW